MKYPFLKYSSITIILLLIVFYLFNFISYHISILYFPFQLEYREGAQLLVASELYNGNLPYTLENQPYLADVFGCMYPLIVIPMFKLFGIKLFTLRLLTAICVFLSTLFFFLFLKKSKINLTISVLVSIIFYGVNMYSCIPICRPDALGFLFFILALYIPTRRNYSSYSLILSIILSYFAYLTKSYFIVAFPFVLIYVFLFKNIFRSIKYFCYLVAGFIILQILIYFIFDFYFLGTFIPQFLSSVFDLGHLLRQLNFYFLKLLLIPSILIGIFLMYFLLKKRNVILNVVDHKINLRELLNLNDFNKPFIRYSKPVNENILYCILGLCLIIFKLGGHTGQFGVYLIHFLSFSFLFLFAFIVNKYYSKFRIAFFVLFLLIFKQLSKEIIIDPSAYNTSSFNKISTYIKNNKKVLSTPMFASILINNKKPVYESGLTEYFYYVPTLKNSTGIPKPLAMLKDKLILKTILKAEKKGDNYLHFIEKSIKNKTFDLILIDDSEYDNWILDSKILFKNYKIVDKLNVIMYSSYLPFEVYVLKPI